MHIKFIKWGAEIDDSFRARYFELVGESIQANPPELGGLFIVGSSRVTDEQADQLAGEFTGIFVTEIDPFTIPDIEVVDGI